MFTILYFAFLSVDSSKSSGNLMTVFLTNTMRDTISIDLPSEASVQCMRNAIINDTAITRGIPHHQCNLRFGDKVLQNEQLLSDLGIGAQCCVEVECAVEDLSKLDEMITCGFPWGSATIDKAVQKLRILGRGAALARVSGSHTSIRGTNEWCWWIFKDDYETYHYYRFMPEYGLDAWRHIKEIPQHRIAHVEPMKEGGYIQYVAAKELQSLLDRLVMLCFIVSLLVMVQMRQADP